MDEETFRRALLERSSTIIPHMGELGIRMTCADADFTEARLPCRAEFLGDLERGIVHTGIVTTLIDSISGIAIYAHLAKMETIATLDLRVDYLRASVLGADLVCRAECYRVTGQIAFVRASVWQTSEHEPVATALATFMRGSANKPGAF